jgi:peptidoglycan/xylan/chitin deacetylase (PgdA/CDA1 family)
MRGAFLRRRVDDPTGIIRDVEKALEEYHPEPGAVFVATDAPARFLGDGERWQFVSADGRTGRVGAEGQATAGRGAAARRGVRGGALNYEAGYTRPVFHWSFDGGLLNNYRHRDVFTEMGTTPTLAISPARLGEEGRMTWERLRQLQSERGWGVSNHGHRHDRFDELTPAEQEAEVVDAIEAFRRHGVDHRHYTYSWGMAGGATGRSVVANHYPYAWGTVHPSDASGIVDVASPYALPRVFIEHAETEAITAAIDRAIERETGMILFGHNLVDGESVDPDGFETDVERVRRLTAYVRDEGGEWVDGVEEVVRYSRTPVRIAGGAEPVGVDDLDATEVRADRVRVDDVGVSAHRSTGQSIPPGAPTRIALDATRFDHLGAFDPDLEGVVPSTPGTYRLAGVVHLETGPEAGEVRLEGRRDGQREAVATTPDGDGSTTRSLQVEVPLELDGGEALTLAVEHGTGEPARTRPGRAHVRLDLTRLG